MSITPDQVMAVLVEIGKTISVIKSTHDTCNTKVELSNGWTLDIFDECCSEFDYLEAVTVEGVRYDFWEPPYDRDFKTQTEDSEYNRSWDSVRDWSPSDRQLELMELS